MKVFLNPGHTYTGCDPGAVNDKYMLTEGEVVHDIGQYVAQYLRAAGGYDVKTMQSDNLFLRSKTYNTFYSVIATANRWLESDNPEEIFVSIHCNSVDDTSIKGTECLMFSEGGYSEKLAQCIQNQIVNSMHTVDRPLKIRPDLAVLRDTTAPAVLVETAFISNEEDVQLLIHKQKEIAAAIARGISDYAQLIHGGK